MIEILTKIGAKITIIVEENREPYYFLIIYECEEVPYPYSLIKCWFQLLTPMSGLCGFLTQTLIFKNKTCCSYSEYRRNAFPGKIYSLLECPTCIKMTT